jgi:hypothetical protein
MWPTLETEQGSIMKSSTGETQLLQNVEKIPSRLHIPLIACPHLFKEFFADLKSLKNVDW